MLGVIIGFLGSGDSGGDRFELGRQSSSFLQFVYKNCINYKCTCIHKCTSAMTGTREKYRRLPFLLKLILTIIRKKPSHGNN